MYVVGTAGHVDHGKSTLIQALTGIDPDRLEEEKRRGLTIDLGFAWLDLPSGRTVGIVDVPGHERFIKNMLAGVGAVNATLFVVAANEGWKPQSQEHLDILNLLGVSAAIIVLTKIDTLDGEGSGGGIEAAADAVRSHVRSTILEEAPVIPVSAVAGTGLAELKGELDRLLSATPPAEDRQRPRLWIDRVFSMKGSGTVVTGTLTGGSLAKGEDVSILPDGESARIRSIQSHHREFSEVGPGNRVAVNLAGLEQGELRRGDVLTRPKTWWTTDHIVAHLSFLEHGDYTPSEKGAFKLYVGSLELDATVRFLEDPPEPGGETFALVRLDRPAAFDFRDRFILRDSGRRQTLGGGIVLETRPGPAAGRRRQLADQAHARIQAGSRLDYFRILLTETGFLPLEEIPLRTGLTASEFRQVPAVWLPSFAVSQVRFETIGKDLERKVRLHHSERPLDAGMPLAVLRSEAGMDPRLLGEIADELGRRGIFVFDASSIRVPDFQPQIDSPEKRRLLDRLESAGASVPTASEIREEFSMDLVRALTRTGELVQVSPELFYPPASIADLKRRVAGLVEASGPFTVAQFRDMIGATRKYAVPLLEYLDGTGFTRRQGDVRTLGPAGLQAQPSASGRQHP